MKVCIRLEARGRNTLTWLAAQSLYWSISLGKIIVAHHDMYIFRLFMLSYLDVSCVHLCYAETRCMLNF
jgi:hypothetical protein